MNEEDLKMPKKKVNKKKLKKPIILTVNICIALVIVILSAILVKNVIEINVLPGKYFYPFIGGIIGVNLIADVLLFLNKIWSRIIAGIFYVILIAISVLGIKYLSQTIRFLNKSFNNNDTETTIYDVVVPNSSSFTKLSSINNLVLGYLSTDETIEDAKRKIDSQITVTYMEHDDIYSLYQDLVNGQISAMLVDETYLSILEDGTGEENSEIDINSVTKIIYTFKIEKKIEQKTEEVKKLQVVNIYVSGSDSRSKKIYNKSRSDVNMILTINPDTKTILMTSLPRDYYVQVHGKTGLKDKLTHSGIYGVDVTAATVEDLLNIKIDYTVKVGFSSVITLVDLVGGIDVYSEKSYTTWCGDGGAVKTKIVKGWNHLDGSQALSYARERHAYSSGDRQRTKNQQEVLQKVFTKILNSKTLLTNYGEILDALSTMYITTIPSSYVQLMVKNQIDDMSGWEFQSLVLSGADSHGPTYTSPSSNLYVMLPYEKDITKATNAINTVLNGGKYVEEEATTTTTKLATAQ